MTSYKHHKDNKIKRETPPFISKTIVFIKFE